jgi:hypothetical protein
MDSLRADRVSLLLARQLPAAIRAYYKQVDESTEEQLPADHVVRVEQLEPLGLAIQMYCVFLRALECDQPGADRLIDAAWRTLDLTPEVRHDVVAQARELFRRMRDYPVFHANATAEEMVMERCASIQPLIARAPELRDYVRTVSLCFDRLQQFAIV